jgi:hypothetical protein
MVNAAASRRWNPDVEPVSEILAALDVEVDDATRREMEKIFRRRQYFHGDGRGHLTLLIRTIIESEGNEGALVVPVVAAVESAMRPQWTSTGIRWLEAFDRIPLLSTLDAMRSLELFRESSLGEYLGISIQNRLWKAFGPDELPKPVKVKPPKKPPARVTRVPVIEKRIELGLKLIELRSRAKSNVEFGELRRRHFPDLATLEAAEMMKVARVCGNRPEIFGRVSWQALVELASRSLSASKRTRFETDIIAGKQVTAKDVRKARSRRCGARQSAPAMQAAA